MCEREKQNKTHRKTNTKLKQNRKQQVKTSHPKWAWPPSSKHILISNTKKDGQHNEHSENEFTSDKINSIELTEIFKLIFWHSQSDKWQKIRDILNDKKLGNKYKLIK